MPAQAASDELVSHDLLLRCLESSPASLCSGEGYQHQMPSEELETRKIGPLDHVAGRLDCKWQREWMRAARRSSKRNADVGPSWDRLLESVGCRKSGMTARAEREDEIRRSKLEGGRVWGAASPLPNGMQDLLGVMDRVQASSSGTTKEQPRDAES